MINKVGEWTSRLKSFLNDAKAELKKVTWPTRRQTLASTFVVIIISVVLAVFLGIVDLGLAKIIKLILG